MDLSLELEVSVLLRQFVFSYIYEGVSVLKQNVV